MNKCVFDEARLYRYVLVHDWRDALFPEPEKPVAWIGLNPSTADEASLDPTLRRIKAFSAGWGFNSFRMLNLFAFRATEPEDMKAARDPVGPENDAALIEHTEGCRYVVCAWGNDGAFSGRAAAVIGALWAAGRSLVALRITGAGHPGHPLYLPAKLQPFPFPLSNVGA